MSRVLARSMFKKNAPKRSAKGVGITSMFDDAPGYAEGGEVDSERVERERIARSLLDRGREEYQRFSEGERPQMTRPPATMPAPPQMSPQQMQAAQMQQLAQMGMLPRFQEGGIVSAPMTNPGFQSPAMRYQASQAATRAQMEAAGQPTVTQQVYSDVTSTPEYLEASRLMDEGRAFNNREMYLRGLSEVRRLTDQAYSGRGAPELPEQGPGTTAREALGMGKSPPPPSPEGPPAPPTQEPRLEEVPSPPPRPSEEELSRKPASKTKGGGGITSVPAGQGRPKATDLQEIKDSRRENAWLALMQAGLAMASGQSSNALTNIAQGAQAGLGSFVGLEKDRRESERRQRELALKQAMADREFGLQERRLAMQAPLIQAQTELALSRPAMAAAKAQADNRALLARARMKAVEDIDAQEAKNPMIFAGPNGKPDPIKKELALRRRTQLLAAEYASVYGGGGQADGLDLGIGGAPGEE